MEDIKKLKKAILYIHHWALKNGVDYYSLGHVIKQDHTIIDLTYTQENNRYCKECGRLIKASSDYKDIYVDLESKEAKQILKEFEGD